MKSIIKVILLTLILSACSHAAENIEEASEMEWASPAPTPTSSSNNKETTEEVTNSDEETPKTHGSASETPPPVKRKLVKTGTLEYQLSSIDSFMAALQQLFNKYNAYIENENQNTYGDQLHTNITVRVPVAHFDTCISNVQALLGTPTYKQTHVNDVTTQYVDVQARLIVRKEIEQQYIDLLKQGEDVADILYIQDELRELREGTEALESRLKALARSTSYSTLHLRLRQEIESPITFSTQMVEAFSKGWDYFLTFLIGITHIWFFIVLFISILVFIKFRKK